MTMETCVNERERDKNAARRLAILRHAEEVTGNVALTCRYYGITRQAFYLWRRRYEAGGLAALRDRGCGRAGSGGGGLGIAVAVPPGGVLVVCGAGFQAAVQDADQPVAELAQRGAVALAAAAQLVVIGAGAG